LLKQSRSGVQMIEEDEKYVVDFAYRVEKGCKTLLNA
jgi:hypothetical protein